MHTKFRNTNALILRSSTTSQEKKPILHSKSVNISIEDLIGNEREYYQSPKWVNNQRISEKNRLGLKSDLIKESNRIVNTSINKALG